MRTVGIGTRIINFIVDTAIVSLVSYLLNRANDFYQYYWKFAGFSGLTIFCVVSVVYYTISEGLFGTSLGKKASISKVVDKGGRRPNFLQIVVRSLVRLFPLDFVSIPFTDRTLHDIASGTYVVEK
ncbi:MAG: RDD family protein [Chitinophagaceae bacterium]